MILKHLMLIIGGVCLGLLTAQAPTFLDGALSVVAMVGLAIALAIEEDV